MKISRKLISGILLLSAIFIASCSKEDAEEIASSVGVNTTDDRDKFAYSWNCIETSKLNGISPPFSVIIAKTAVPTQITVENFYNLGASSKPNGNVSGTSFVISQQTVSGNSVKGAGTWVSANQVTMAYTVDPGSGPASIDSCTAILTK